LPNGSNPITGVGKGKIPWLWDRMGFNGHGSAGSRHPDACENLWIEAWYL